MRRKRIPRKKSKRDFTRGAVKVKKRNFTSTNPQRGGIRL